MEDLIFNIFILEFHNKIFRTESRCIAILMQAKWFTEMIRVRLSNLASFYINDEHLFCMYIIATTSSKHYSNAVSPG